MCAVRARRVPVAHLVRRIALTQPSPVHSLLLDPSVRRRGMILSVGLLVLAGAAMETGYLPGDKIDVVGDIPLRLLSESSSGESASGESASGESEGCNLCSDLCTGDTGDGSGRSAGQDANGMCQDGGPGSEIPTCDYGTDCSDCGPRCPLPSPPPAPPVAPPPPASPPPTPRAVCKPAASTAKKRRGRDKKCAA